MNTKTIVLALLIALSPLGASAATLFPGSGGTGSTTLSGILKGNGTSPVRTAVGGIDFTLITAKTCTAGDFFSAVTALGTFTCSTPTGGAGGTGNVGTSSVPVIGGLAYWTTTTATPALLSTVATTTLTATSPLSLSQPIFVIGPSASALSIDTSGAWTGNAGTATALAANGTNCTAGNYPLGVDASGNAESCTAAAAGTVTAVTATWPLASSGGTTPVISSATSSGSSAGVLSAADWTTFNGKLSSVTADSPLSGSGTSASHLVLSTAGTWSGNAGTATALAADGSNCSSGYFALGVDTVGASQGCTMAVATTTANTWTGTQTFNSTIAGSINGNAATVTNGVYTTDTGTVSNTMLAGSIANNKLSNSTISGIALGSNLNSLSNDATLSGTSYNGSAAISDWGIDLAHANTWTGLQTFNNATTTLLSGSTAWFTTFIGALTGNASTATALATGRTLAITGDLAWTSPSFDGSGNVTAAGTLATVNTNVGSFTNANITVNGKGLITAASSGTGGGAWPFTPSTNFGVAVQSTSTPAWFTTGVMASSTSQFVDANFWGNVNITGNATTSNLTVNSGATGTTTVQVGQATNPACIAMRDTDNGAATYLYVKGGVLYTTTTSCI